MQWCAYRREIIWSQDFRVCCIKYAKYTWRDPSLLNIPLYPLSAMILRKVNVMIDEKPETTCRPDCRINRCSTEPCCSRGVGILSCSQYHLSMMMMMMMCYEVWIEIRANLAEQSPTGYLGSQWQRISFMRLLTCFNRPGHIYSGSVTHQHTMWWILSPRPRLNCAFSDLKRVVLCLIDLDFTDF